MWGIERPREIAINKRAGPYLVVKFLKFRRFKLSINQMAKFK